MAEKGRREVKEFCEQVLRRAEELCTESPDRTSLRLRAADRIVELCGPNTAFLGLLERTFAHLVEPEGGAASCTAPALRVILWDSRSTGVEMLPAPWRPEDFGMRDRLRNNVLDGGRWRISYDLGRGMLCVLDAERRLGMCWVQDASRTPEYERAATMLPIWTWWLQSIGMRLVHGAAVGFPDGGVLITARGGSGKSTTAMACLTSELSYAADDYCIVSGGVAPAVHSLFETGKLRTMNSISLPHLNAQAFHSSLEGAVAAESKRIYHLHPTWSHKLIAKFPLRAVLVPEIHAGSETNRERISAARALRALAPSTLFQLAGDEVVDLRFLGDLVRTLPCYVLRLGSDPAGVPAAIAALLRELGAGRSVA